MHPLPDEPAAAFTTAAFADISEDPVSDEAGCGSPLYSVHVTGGR